MRVIPTFFVIAVSTLIGISNAGANEPTTTTTTTVAPAPHCEVPCGIYDDQHRFEEMLEDTATIAKAIAGINEIGAGMHEGPPSAKNINQMIRWVNTKEAHATNIQQIAAQYFLTQRIKADSERYDAQLKAAHSVMVAAMKCKQDVDAATAETLKKSIYDLYRAYEGKEPELHDEQAKDGHSK
ncbi:MAG: superoxide dismutase [Ni] [Pirellulaceae bacterium]